MVVAGRLLWVIEKINLGHQVVISSSFNTNGEKQKLKVLIQPIAGAVFGPEINQGIAWAALMFLSHIANNEPLARSVCLTDRGHKHSNGVSEVSFWMTVKKAVFDGSGVTEAEEKTVVSVTDAHSDVARGSFPSPDAAIEEDIEKDGDVSEDESSHGRSRSFTASADGEDKRVVVGDEGFEDDLEDLGLASRMNSCEGASGSIVENMPTHGAEFDRCSDVPEEGGSRHKKP